MFHISLPKRSKMSLTVLSNICVTLLFKQAVKDLAPTHAVLFFSLHFIISLKNTEIIKCFMQLIKGKL